MWLDFERTIFMPSYRGMHLNRSPQVHDGLSDTVLLLGYGRVYTAFQFGLIVKTYLTLKFHW